jgi:HPt (histidine-containing phosphotransfer) domain-containing protein
MNAMAFPEAVLDLGRFRERTLHDEEILREVAEVFLGELPRWVEELRGAVASADLSRLRLTAHLAAGTAATCGAARLSAAARRLEEQAKRGWPEEASRLVEEVAVAAEEVAPVVSGLL